MAFLKNDNSFICGHCGEKVEKLKYSSRNHCNKCLWSLHVDIDPGDRLNECKGLMEPIGIEYNSNKGGYIIIHKCTKCGEIKKNRVSQDDNYDEILKLSNKNLY